MTETRTFNYPPSPYWLFKYVGGPIILAMGVAGLLSGIIKLVRILCGIRAVCWDDLMVFVLGYLFFVSGGVLATSHPSLRIEPDGLAVEVFGPFWQKVRWKEIERIRRVAPDVRFDERLYQYYVQNYVIDLTRFVTPWHVATILGKSKWWRASLRISEDIEDSDELLDLIQSRAGISIQ